MAATSPTVRSSSPRGVDPAVRLVVKRYGDCIRNVGDRLRGQVLPSSTDEHTIVGFGPKPLRFSVTGLRYVIAADALTAQAMRHAGPTC